MGRGVAKGFCFVISTLFCVAALGKTLQANCSDDALRQCKVGAKDCRRSCKNTKSLKAECLVSCEEQVALCEDTAQSKPDCGLDAEDNKEENKFKFAQFAEDP
jgi:hypothetical protein